MSYGMGRESIPSGFKKASVQQFTPQQMKLFKSMFQNVGPDSFTSRLAQGEEGIFDELEAPAFKQFEGLQGQMGSRFSGMGMGARKGSGFQNEATQASSDFAQQLQSQRMGLQSQAIKDLMGMSSDLLGQRPYQQSLVEKQQKAKPWWQEMMTGFAGGAGSALTKGVMGGF